MTLKDNTNNFTFTLENLSFLDMLKTFCFSEAKARGFHLDEDGDDKIKNFGDYISNLHDEVSELWGAYRKGELYKRCDKADEMQYQHQLEPLTCSEEEIADILIRTLDTAARLKINVAKAVFYKLLFNRTRAYRHGNKLA